MSQHAIDPKPVSFCCTCGARGVCHQSEGRTIFACPNGHAPWLPPGCPVDDRTPGERFVEDVTALPRLFLADVVDALEAKVPDRAKPLAREAAKVAGESLLEMLTKSDRKTVPR